MRGLKDKVALVTGAASGIGLAIAKRAARDGARIAIAAKTDSPNPRLEGTVHSAAEEIRAAGGQALPMELRAGVAYDAELLAEVRRRLGEGLVDLRLA